MEESHLGDGSGSGESRYLHAFLRARRLGGVDAKGILEVYRDQQPRQLSHPSR